MFQRPKRTVSMKNSALAGRDGSLGQEERVCPGAGVPQDDVTRLPQ
jgi:hypothetical protein